jgi:hypothetical protein
VLEPVGLPDEQDADDRRAPSNGEVHGAELGHRGGQGAGRVLLQDLGAVAQAGGAADRYTDGGGNRPSV